VWKKRMIQVLWITTGVALVVLLGAAMKQKNHKVCTEVKIEISGAEEHMFMDEKDILHIVNASGNVVGKDVSTISLQQMETELEMNAWVKNAELFFNNQQVLTDQYSREATNCKNIYSTRKFFLFRYSWSAFAFK
jgi:cell division protein FtsQ